MRISIHSKDPLEKYYLMDLNDNHIHFPLDTDFDLQYNWYCLVVESVESTVEINDVHINDQSVGHMLYTSFAIDKHGNKHQPATVLWEPGMKFIFWIHKELGMMQQQLFESIRNGDFGTNLFDDYLFTVDKPIEIDHRFPEQIKSYFRVGSGPRWWKKGGLSTPYEIADKDLLASIDKQKLIEEIPLDCELELKYEEQILNVYGKSVEITTKAIKPLSTFPFANLQGTELQKLTQGLGFSGVLNVMLQTMPAGCSFRPHIDDHYKKDSFEHLAGPVVFLWNLAEDTSQQLFRLSSAGLLPIEQGVFFNQNYYSHGTANCSDKERPLLIITGERDQKLDLYT